MEKFYKEDYQNLTHVLNLVKDNLNNLSYTEHIYSRIKSPESIKQKLKKKKLEISLKSAYTNLFDIIGIRIIVRFIDDIYKIFNYIQENFEIKKIKDYISKPKENGYRSLHVIIEITYDNIKYNVEIQIRTISQDSWASLEHKMKYKKEIKNYNIITNELKRCADEMASIDVSMQMINEMIINGIN